MLRVVSVLGKGLQKNVIFDLVHEMPLWVTPDSIYNYISSEDLSDIIALLINYPIKGILNVGAKESIRIDKVAEITGTNPTYGEQKDEILVDVEELLKIYPVKTSAEYVKDFWREYVYGE